MEKISSLKRSSGGIRSAIIAVIGLQCSQLPALRTMSPAISLEPITSNNSHVKVISPKFYGEVGPVRLDVITQNGGVTIFAHRIVQTKINSAYVTEAWSIGWERLCSVADIRCTLDNEIGSEEICIPANRGWSISPAYSNNIIGNVPGNTTSTINDYPYICFTGRFEIADQVEN